MYVSFSVSGIYALVGCEKHMDARNNKIEGSEGKKVGHCGRIQGKSIIQCPYMVKIKSALTCYITFGTDCMSVTLYFKILLY